MGTLARCAGTDLRMVENGKTPEEALQFLARTLTNKLLHTPSTRLREASSAGHTELLEAANTLFKLRPGTPEKP